MHQGCVRWRGAGREAGAGGRGRSQAGGGAGDYYTREIAQNREEYLSGHGESPGRWYGQGATSLGQSGEASTEAFGRIFEGCHPETGELLGRAHGRNAVPAFDVVFRPTKSVSLLYGLGDAATGGRCWPPTTPGWPGRSPTLMGTLAPGVVTVGRSMLVGTACCGRVRPPHQPRG
jgi:hypothetical protein